MNVDGTRNVVALGAPVVYFSTDYVFDGAKLEPYVESDEPNPLSVYARTKLEGERELREGWIVRSSWLFGWTSKNFVRTMLELGSKQDEVSGRRRPARVADLRRPSGGGNEGCPPASARYVPRCCRRRLHVGGVRGGDLRGGGPRMPRPTDHDAKSSADRPRARPTRSSAASEVLRSSRPGAKASAPASPACPNRTWPVSDAQHGQAGRVLSSQKGCKPAASACGR